MFQTSDVKTDGQTDQWKVLSQAKINKEKMKFRNFE